MLEVIDESIRVCAYFRRGVVSPLWFDWKGRRYKIKGIRNRWVTNEGTGRCYHFAITADDAADLYEIYLRSETMSWHLANIDVSS